MVMNSQERERNCSGGGDPRELVDRVKTMVKPVASIVIQNFSKTEQDAIGRYCSEMGVCTFLHRNRTHGRVMLVYNSWDAELSEYWNINELVKAYGGGACEELASVLSLPIRALLKDLSNETLSLRIIGLLYGYPLSENSENDFPAKVHNGDYQTQMTGRGKGGKGIQRTENLALDDLVAQLENDFAEKSPVDEHELATMINDITPIIAQVVPEATDSSVVLAELAGLEPVLAELAGLQPVAELATGCIQKMKSGARKGQACGRKTATGAVLCRYHHVKPVAQESQCTTVLRSGARKGQECGKKVVRDGRCTSHCKGTATKVVAPDERRLCPYLLKKGARKGQGCGLKEGKQLTGFCAKHATAVAPAPKAGKPKKTPQVEEEKSDSSVRFDRSLGVLLAPRHYLGLDTVWDFEEDSTYPEFTIGKYTLKYYIKSAKRGKKEWILEHENSTIHAHEVSDIFDAFYTLSKFMADDVNTEEPQKLRFSKGRVYDITEYPEE